MSTYSQFQDLIASSTSLEALDNLSQQLLSNSDISQQDLVTALNGQILARRGVIERAIREQLALEQQRRRATARSDMDSEDTSTNAPASSAYTGIPALPSTRTVAGIAKGGGKGREGAKEVNVEGYSDIVGYVNKVSAALPLRMPGIPKEMSTTAIKVYPKSTRPVRSFQQAIIDNKDLTRLSNSAVIGTNLAGLFQSLQYTGSSPYLGGQYLVPIMKQGIDKVLAQKGVDKRAVENAGKYYDHYINQNLFVPKTEPFAPRINTWAVRTLRRLARAIMNGDVAGTKRLANVFSRYYTLSKNEKIAWYKAKKYYGVLRRGAQSPLGLDTYLKNWQDENAAYNRFVAMKNKLNNVNEATFKTKYRLTHSFNE